MTPAERHFYDRGRYGEIAAKVDLCLAHHDKPCRGGECEERPCERHARTMKVVDRLSRLRTREN